MKKIILAIGAAAVALALGACHGNGPGASPGASARVSALATNTAVQAVRQDFSRCFPASAVAQIKEVHQLLKDTKAHPNGSWKTLLDCMGITEQDKPAFEAKALAAAEAAGPSLLTRTGLKTYFEVTLPGIAASFARPSASPSPSCSHVSNQGGNQGTACASVKP